MAVEPADTVTTPSAPDSDPARRIASSVPSARSSVMALGWIGLTMALAMWAIASPPGASPDDDFHLLSIFCSDAESGPDADSMCRTGSTDTEVLAPVSMVEAHVCYAFAPAESARCQTDRIDWDPNELVPTERLNTDGLYPTGYYSFANRFTGTDIVASVKLLRLVNVAVVMALWAIVLAAVSAPLRLAFWSSLFLTSVPLGVFIIASNNPSSWASAGIAGLWPVTYQWLFGNGSRARQWAAGAGMVLCCLVAFSAHGDAAVFAVVTFVAMVLLHPSPLRDLGRILDLRRVALPVMLSVWAAVVYLSADQGAAAAGGLQGDEPLRPLGTVFVANVLSVHELWLGVWGALGGLNWLDTPMVPWVASLQIVTGVFVLVTCIRFADRKKRLALWFLGIVLFVLPLYLLGVGGYIVGEAVQSRYLLPLIYVVMGIALYRDRGSALVGFRTPVLGAIGLAVTVAHSTALHIQLRRFITGTDVSDWNLNSGVEWWWTSRISPMGVWIIGSVSFAVFGASAMAALHRGARLPVADER